MNETEQTPETAHKPTAAEVTPATVPPPPEQQKKKKKAAPKTPEAKPEEQAITTQKQAEDLSKVIDAFLIGNKTAEKLTQAQITLCKQTALAFGLNPLKREIHFVPREIKRKNPTTGYWDKTGEWEVSIIIGYEVYIKRAEATGKLNGWGVRFEKEGADTKAIITIHKKGWENPFEHEVYLSEARQERSPIWDKMPRFMLRKVTIGQGFRLAFPEEMGGLPYLPEEIGAGIIENGELVEEKKTIAPPAAAAAPLPPPAPITVQQCTTILGLLVRKGKNQQKILDYFKVEKLSQLTFRQGQAVIIKLQNTPDLADKAPAEDITALDMDEIDKGIEQQRLNADSQEPEAPAEGEAK